MYHLARLIPAIERIPLPFTRDQLMLLMIAVNLIFLGLDTYLAHVANQALRPNEWIPILFGPIGGGLLLIAGLIALKQRLLAISIATLVLLASAVVGFLGAYLHLIRGILPTAPAGQQVTLNLLVWAPPILAPLMFAIVGILGLSAAWPETPADSGRLKLWRDRYLQLPYSKTQAYFYIVSMASLAALISSVLDHGRHNFENPWVWLPVVVGVFATVVAAGMGYIDQPSHFDLWVYVAAMVLLIVLGLIGLGLHIQADLTASGSFVLERFLRGAPVLAPMLFADVGALGLLVLLDPNEEV